VEKWLSAYKNSNITEMGQDNAKVTVDVLSMGAKIKDLG